MAICRISAEDTRLRLAVTAGTITADQLLTTFSVGKDRWVRLTGSLEGAGQNIQSLSGQQSAEYSRYSVARTFSPAR